MTKQLIIEHFQEWHQRKSSTRKSSTKSTSIDKTHPRSMADASEPNLQSSLNDSLDIHSSSSSPIYDHEYQKEYLETFYKKLTQKNELSSKYKHNLATESLEMDLKSLPKLTSFLHFNRQADLYDSQSIKSWNEWTLQRFGSEMMELNEKIYQIMVERPLYTLDHYDFLRFQSYLESQL